MEPSSRLLTRWRGLRRRRTLKPESPPQPLVTFATTTISWRLHVGGA